jgi:O-antigen/teichoic acid export membrane protein
LSAGGVSSILLAWIGAFFASALAGYFYLRIFMPEFRFRLFASRATARAVVDVGLRNAALNVTTSVPVLIIPIVITEVLSPSDNAYWYAAWMFAGLASFISNGATTALFSELTNRPDLKRKRARQTIRLCLVLGIPTALGIAVFGEFGLRLMGQDYADAGIMPLRILLIGMLARPFIATYVTEQRSSNSYAEPTAFGAISGTAVVTGAAIGGALYGLNGAAVAWVVVQILAALWASWRMRHIWAGSTATDAPIEEPASVVRAVIPGPRAGKGG